MTSKVYVGLKLQNNANKNIGNSYISQNSIFLANIEGKTRYSSALIAWLLLSILRIMWLLALAGPVGIAIRC